MVWRGIGATGPWFSIPYFLLLVAVGHFFVLNLFLAVIFDNFDSIADAERAAKGQSELMEAATSEGREKSEQREAKRKADEAYISPIARCLPERFRLRKLVDSRNFRLTTVALILLNAALALHYYPHCPTDAGCATAPEYLLYVHTLEIISHVFTALFWVEMLLKVGGLGPRLYIMGQGGGWNAFDLFVNLLSLLDLALMTYFDSENNPSPANLNVLRTFRLLRALRVLRLTRSFPALRKVLGTIMQSSAQIFYLFLLMLIFMVIFSLLGMELFAKPMDDPLWDGSPYRFDNTLHGMVTIFVVLSGENWNEVLYTGTGSLGSPLAAALYYIVAFTIFNYVLLNLFIAILLSNITSLPMEEESERRPSVGQAQFVHWFVYRRTVLWARRALQPDEMRPRSTTRLSRRRRVRHQTSDGWRNLLGDPRRRSFAGASPPKPPRPPPPPIPTTIHDGAQPRPSRQWLSWPTSARSPTALPPWVTTATLSPRAIFAPGRSLRSSSLISPAPAADNDDNDGPLDIERTRTITWTRRAASRCRRRLHSAFGGCRLPVGAGRLTPRLRRFALVGGCAAARVDVGMVELVRRRRWRRTRSKCRRASRSILPTARRGRRHRARVSAAVAADARAVARRSVGRAMRRRRGRYMYKPVQYRREQPGRRRALGRAGSAPPPRAEAVERASPPRSERASKAGLDFLRSRIRRITEAEDSAKTDDRGWRSPRPAGSLGSCSAPPPPAARTSGPSVRPP